jgi:hypothetical protein
MPPRSVVLEVESWPRYSSRQPAGLLTEGSERYPGPRMTRQSKLLFAMAAALMAGVNARGQVAGHSWADFSGTWRVEETHNFSPNAPANQSTRLGFTFRIAQTQTEVRIILPYLPAIVFNRDGSENQYVHDNGDSWTKFTTVARWDGELLSLKSITLNGWWKDSNPASVNTQPTQLEETRLLRLERAGTRLRLEVQSHDEKPFSTRYVDLLRRVP